MKINKAHIKAISYYLPEKTLSNAQLVDLFPQLKEEGIFKATGVKIRHITAPGIIGSDLAYFSAVKFFEEQPHKKEEIDFLLYCTHGLDFKGPTSACILHERIGLPNKCGAMDIPYGCTGFTYGIAIAKSLIESKLAKNVLLLTSDIPSTVIHPQNQDLRSIFGDAGACTLISESAGDSSIGSFVFGTDGKGAKNLIVRNSGTREPVTREYLEKNADAGGMPYGTMEMNGAQIYIFAARVVPPMVKELLEKENLQMEDIDLFVFHQASGFLLEILRRRLKIPPEKFFVFLENVGNTVSATIPIALREALDAGKIKPGSKVLLAGFGIGYSWAGTIVRW